MILCTSIIFHTPGKTRLALLLIILYNHSSVTDSVTSTYYVQGNGEMAIKVHVGDVIKETCTVDFKEQQFELLFQTHNETFLSSYTGSNQTTFVWKVQLHDTIQPSVSRFEVTPRTIDIVLKKAFDKKWTMLERSKRQSSLTNSSSNSNPVAESDQASSDQNEPSLNALVTDLSIADDVIATPPSQAQTIRNVGGNSPDPIQNHYSSAHGNHAPPTSSNAAAEHHHGNEVGEPVQKIYTNPLYKAPSSKTSKQKPHSHYTHTVAASELEMSDPSFREKQLGQPSKTGLINLGNTCFMNSVIQCLSNTPEMRDYFVKGHYLANINLQNPLGFEGKLAKCFCMILRKLWSGEYKSFSPRKLLEIVAKRSKYFSGNSQHDTHEFMSYLIDGLHEDLNRVREKPVTEPVEMEDYPDREVAEESWRVHKKRNDSMIVDLFQGQFKSTLVCQECNKESVTFDPFMSLSVPIPRNLRRLPVIFVPRDPNSLPKQLILQLPPEATLKLLKASVGRRTSLSMAQLRVFEVYKGKFQSLMSDNNHPISGIKSSDTIIVSEVLSERAANGPVVEINVVQRVHVAPFPTKCALCGCGVEKGRKMLRCSKCKAVGYCHRTCQERDWPEHKRKCGKVKVFPTGLPFVISLPANKLTYSRLTEYAEKFSRGSICVRRRETKLNHEKHDRIQESAESMQTSEGSIQESAESMQTSEGSIQESAESMQTSEGSMQESTESVQSSQESMEVCTESMQECAESIQGSTGDIQEGAMYTLIRVNRFLEPVSGAVPLQDKGETPLVFHDKTVYLAMDWRDDPKDDDSVIVTPKPTMEYEEDEKADTRHRKSSDTVSLTDCLQLFTEPETLSQEEAWYCPRCEKHRPAIKQMSVWKLPQFLVVHLKRFLFHNSVWRSKIDHLVSFPLGGLDMSPYLLGDAAEEISPETPPIYDLYATVNHYGNIYIGHYVATVKPPLSNEKEWLCYDDDRVWSISPDKIPCSEAYVLIYRRRIPS
jgi:ubiquitin carboxyl-terminal hydrolase 19